MTFPGRGSNGPAMSIREGQGTPPVIILEIAGEDASTGVLIEDDHLVQALSPDAADESLGI